MTTPQLNPEIGADVHIKPEIGAEVDAVATGVKPSGILSPTSFGTHWPAAVT